MSNRGRRIEDGIIRHLRARKHVNSGAMKDKYDADTQDLLIEVKSTTKKQFAVNREYIQNLMRHAGIVDKIPVIILAWDDGDAIIELADINVVCSLPDFLEILNYSSTHSYDEFTSVKVK